MISDAKAVPSFVTVTVTSNWDVPFQDAVQSVVQMDIGASS